VSGLVVVASGCPGLADAVSYVVVLLALLALPTGITFLRIAGSVTEP
jgi:hypothetical protein